MKKVAFLLVIVCLTVAGIASAAGGTGTISATSPTFDPSLGWTTTVTGCGFGVQYTKDGTYITSYSHTLTDTNTTTGTTGGTRVLVGPDGCLYPVTHYLNGEGSHLIQIVQSHNGHVTYSNTVEVILSVG